MDIQIHLKGKTKRRMLLKGLAPEKQLPRKVFLQGQPGRHTEDDATVIQGDQTLCQGGSRLGSTVHMVLV